jgi:hypothetical protein
MEDKRPFSSAEWLQTPEPVRAYIEMLEQSILQLSQSLAEMKGRTEKLEQRINRIPKTPASRLLPMGHLRNPSVKRKRASANAAARRATPDIVSSCLIPQKPFRLSLQFAVAAVRSFIMLNPFIPTSRLSCRKLSLKSPTTCFTKAAAVAAAGACRPNWTHHKGRDMVQG